MVEIRACGRNRQRFVVVINPRLAPSFSGEPWGAIRIKALHYKNHYSRREENFAFLRCSFYTVTRGYPQKLVALKIIAAAGKCPDSCIAVSLCCWFAVSLYRRTGFWVIAQ
jgi:hypothetical protein